MMRPTRACLAVAVEEHRAENDEAIAAQAKHANDDA